MLEQYAVDWLGPLAKAVRFGPSFATRFERGFLAEADLVPNSRKLLLPIAADAAWATVEIFTHDVPPQLLDRTPLTALRRISIDRGRFRRLARRAIAFAHVADVDVRTPVEAREARSRVSAPAQRDVSLLSGYRDARPARRDRRARADVRGPRAAVRARGRQRRPAAGRGIRRRSTRGALAVRARQHALAVGRAGAGTVGRLSAREHRFSRAGGQLDRARRAAR